MSAELSTEAKRILAAVQEKHSFVLSGGAGSGKTYTLEETIRELDRRVPGTRIACITYTNAAADEIKGRVETPGLWVSTIHDFLWANIEGHQEELRQCLRHLIRSDDPSHRVFALPDEVSLDDDHFDDLEDGIQYREYVRIRDGIISHDEVLVVAATMFKSHSKLCRIVSDLYPYIFVDEYQDTSRLVVSILDAIRDKSPRCVVGYFGDAMQAIYEGSVGSLEDSISSGELVEIKKEQNRRNPRLVIELANKLRNDVLVQHPSTDLSAPNMRGGKVREGEVRFFYSRYASSDDIRTYLGWKDNEVKELNLTHNLIAKRAGFASLMEIYDGDKILAFVARIKKHLKDNPGDVNPNGKTFEQVVSELQADKPKRELVKVSPTDPMQAYINEHRSDYEVVCGSSYEQISRLFVKKEHLLDDARDASDRTSSGGSERDELVKHLFRIQNCVRLYQMRRYGEFIRLTDFTLRCAGDKVTLRNSMEALANSPTMSIGEVIDTAASSSLVLASDRFMRFREEKSYIYNRVARVPYSEFQQLYQYLEGHTPFSTQHKTKGREYNRVLVVLDDGGWSMYNFAQLFEGGGKESVSQRTLKLFYVCCTRAMEQLVVYFHNPTEQVIAKAKEWFGSEHVVDFDSLERC